jgi:hypothetical protein
MDMNELQQKHLRNMLRMLYHGREGENYDLKTFVGDLEVLLEKGYKPADIVEVVFDELKETRHRLQVMDLFVQDDSVLPVLEKHGWAKNGYLSIPHNITYVYPQRWLDNLARSMRVELAVDTTVWPLEEKSRIKRARGGRPMRNAAGEVVMQTRLRRASVNFARSITLKRVILPDSSTVYPGGRTVQDLPDYPIAGLYLPGCSVLEEVVIPEEATLSYIVLAGCTRLKRLVVKGKITGRIDLAGCNSLEEFSLKKGCGTLHMNGLHTLKALELPPKGRFGDINIVDCGALSSIEFGASTIIHGNLNMIGLPSLKAFKTPEKMRVGGWCDMVALVGLEQMDVRAKIGIHRVPPQFAGQESPGRISHPSIFPMGLSLGLEGPKGG